MPRELRHFVERSLRILDREAPAFFIRLCEMLDGRRMAVADETSVFALHFTRDAVACLAPDGSEDVRVVVNAATLLALIDGELTLENALRQERLGVRSPVGVAADVFDGLVVYVRGAVRCPSAPRLLVEFRQSDAAKSSRTNWPGV